MRQNVVCTFQALSYSELEKSLKILKIYTRGNMHDQQCWAVSSPDGKLIWRRRHRQVIPSFLFQTHVTLFHWDHLVSTNLGHSRAKQAVRILLVYLKQLICVWSFVCYTAEWALVREQRVATIIMVVLKWRHKTRLPS